MKKRPQKTRRWVDLGLWMGGPFTAFQWGTCHGLYQRVAGRFHLFAIVNDVPGNGQFARLMDQLESTNDVCVDRFLNDRGLREHLIQKRGYRPVPGSDDRVEKRRPSCPT